MSMKIKALGAQGEIKGSAPYYSNHSDFLIDEALVSFKKSIKKIENLKNKNRWTFQNFYIILSKYFLLFRRTYEISFYLCT